MALSHIRKWGTEKINRLIIDIIDNKKLTFAEFFDLDTRQLQAEFNLSASDIVDIQCVRTELPAYSFLAENLIEQGFNIIPFKSEEYSATLKRNLTLQKTPPLLYVKGNTSLLNESSVAIVGSRKASKSSLEFTKNIARSCTKNCQVVVSGFAKGVDKTALDAALESNGHSIIVLPQGVLTFGSGIKKYYKKIIEGDVLVLSTYHPKVPWSVGLAMSRNTYIYGLAEKIYVAESDSKGGTWSGVLDGLRKGRATFIRKPEPGEKNANSILILKGAIPVDLNGIQVESGDDSLEHKLKNLFSEGHFTAHEIKDKLELDIDAHQLSKLLSGIDFIASGKANREKVFLLKEEVQVQAELFG